MANHKSAEKRARQNEKRRLRNRMIRSRVKTITKRLLTAVENKDIEKARELLPVTISEIDKASSKGVIHWRTAARKVSRLSKKVAILQAS